MKKTPKQQVEAKFGTRADLVKAIAGLIDADEDTRSSLMGTTNKKLLRIHEVATTVKTRFGGKSGLLDAIEKLQFDGGKGHGTVNQKRKPPIDGLFAPVGVYLFNAKKPAIIEIDNRGTDGYVIIDSIQLVEAKP